MDLSQFHRGTVPQNRGQSLIVHTIPDKPITIEFDPKKGK